MKPKELHIAVSRTFNLGNNQFMRIEAGLLGIVEEGEDIEEARQKVLEELRKSLSAAYRRNHPDSPANPVNQQIRNLPRNAT